VVVGSDIAYHIPLFPLLVQSMLDATSLNSVVFLGITKRDVNNDFLQVAGCCFEWPAPHISTVLMGEHDKSEVQIHIYTMRRKSRPLSILLHPLFVYPVEKGGDQAAPKR
jgi:hypothetical protein